MFDRKEHIEMMRTTMTNWTDEQFEQNADFMEEKYSHLKHGENVIHVHYCGQILTKDDLNEIENQLLKVNYELSSFDDSGIPKNSFDALISQVVLMLNDPIVQQTLTLGLTTNFLWDTIKSIIKFTWRKIKDKTYITIDSKKTVIEKKASFSVQFRLDNNNTFEFKTENLNEQEIDSCLDKILGFLKTVQKSDEPKVPQIAIYNDIESSWEIIEITQEILRQPPRNIVRKMTIEEYIKIYGR